MFFFFNDTATTEIYTLSLHDALPISAPGGRRADGVHHLLAQHLRERPPPDVERGQRQRVHPHVVVLVRRTGVEARPRSEEHTSELQSRQYLVCRLLLEKKKNRWY